MRVSDVRDVVRRWTGRPDTGDGIRLHEGRDLGGYVDRLAEPHGGRVGIDAVLADLDRQADVLDVPATAADYGFGWDDADQADPEWWPQGITTSADASDVDDIGGRKVVVVSWYAKPVNGRSRGRRT